MPIRAGRPNGGEVLDGIGVPVVAEFPKPLTDEVLQAGELVIIMGCGDACPIYSDRRYMSGRPPSDNPWRTHATSGTISPLWHLTQVLLHRAGCAGNSHYLKRIGQ